MSPKDHRSHDDRHPGRRNHRQSTYTASGWHVTTWPHPLDRNAAITALSLAERLVTHGENDACVIEWRRELPRG